MNSLKLVTGPTVWPVSLDQAKGHLRVVEDDDDLIIESFIKASCEYAEEYMGRALYAQTFDLYVDQFPVTGSPLPSAIVLPRSPLLEVVGVFYQDSNDDEQTFDAANYTVSDGREPPRITLLGTSSWPTTRSGAQAVRIRFRSGYVDNSMSPAVGEVPWTIYAALLLHIGHLYANREAVVIGQTAVELPLGVKSLLDMKRVDISLS